MSLRGSVCAAVVLMAAVACAPASETEPLPLQESGLVVAGEVRKSSTPVGQYSMTEEELREFEEECAAAEGVPLEEGDSCQTLIPSLRPGCSPRDICIHVFDVGSVDAPMAGYVEIVDGRPGESLCDQAPRSVCLRVGLSDDALASVARVSPSPSPTTTDTSPTDSSPTDETSSSTSSESTSGSPGSPTGSATP